MLLILLTGTPGAMKLLEKQKKRTNLFFYQLDIQRATGVTLWLMNPLKINRSAG